jgi:sugar lactone lactonase YvrE
VTTSLPRTRAHRITEPLYELAESPRWHAGSGRLYWCDIVAGDVWSAPAGRDGSVGEPELAYHSDDVATSVNFVGDRMVVTTKDRVVTIEADGSIQSSGVLIETPDGRRFNDAAFDRSGRMFAGTLSDRNQESLFRRTADGLETVRSEVALANGIGWSPDETVIYHVDSRRRSLAAAAYDAASGDVGDWEVIAEFTAGYPDGLCVDGGGLIWVALWGAGNVVAVDSDGRSRAVVELAVPHASACALGGPSGSTLYVTTARNEMTADERRQWPDSGAVFSAELKGLWT